MPVPPFLVVRADGGPGIGVGHLARSLALVQAWTDRHGDAALLARGAPAFWSEQFEAEGCAVTDPASWDHEADWWGTDGYHLAGEGHVSQGAHVLLVDDHDTSGTGGEGADLVVDQNLAVDLTRYRGAGAILAGPRYALLRRGLHEESVRSHVPVTARQVVLILGGSPSPEVRALGDDIARDRRLAELDVTVLSGSDDVASALAAADVAVAAAGTVSWELCCRGVPSVLIAVAANQEPVAEEVARAGAAVRSDPDPDDVVRTVLLLAGDGERRADMARIGRSLVDGHGARRVACRLRSELLALRDATSHDAEALHQWSNDPTTRAASFSPAPIVWEQHVAWLRERLARPSAATYIARDALGDDVGLVRFDEVGPGVAEIGVTVAPTHRHAGWGGALVDAGCRRWAGGRGSVRVDARIKVGNVASVRAFVDADFDGSTSRDAEVLRYARHLDGDQRRS